MTEALLSEFPAAEGDELVTRGHLRAELADLRTEMHRLHNRTIGVLIGALGVVTAVLAVVD